MITALDHIAIAVPELETAVARFLGDFGLQYDGDEVVEAEKTATAFFSVPATHIELVAPVSGHRSDCQLPWKSVVGGCITYVFEPTISMRMS
jgi:hypothetical protein